eukprot:TRINITY_DN370_c0_g3_i1.p1 TRINITY_DN370_c0_g3~~TRINITY_DN370_c0_g3_i1.p1  ORF type:complete len:494 (-),score=89.62 TRINITY_DN370_c0_g3_i1:145-1518(-)
MAAAERRDVLVIGSQFTGTFVARELRRRFNVTVVDAKEYFEYTPGILRAYVRPKHFDSLSFMLEPVLVKRMGVKFVLGEVKELDGPRRRATILPSTGGCVVLTFDYCVICSGCNFGPFVKWGESLWSPTVHASAIAESEWRHIDERRLEGRKRHILEEHAAISKMDAEGASVLVVGAGFIGVEWVTELEHYFKGLKLTIIDFLPRCLGPLPDKAASYCQAYLDRKGVKTVYNVKYDPNRQGFWDKIGLPNRASKMYECIGVKASNYFMPKETLSDKGPGGGGWIFFNRHMQVTTKPVSYDPCGPLWANGRVFAVGDCNYGCIGGPEQWEKGGIPPIPKISYPGEEQAYHACSNIERLDAALRAKKRAILVDTWWPWGAGMFATSLGPRDGCFVLGATHKKGSGYMVNRWFLAAIQKDIIERTKVLECKNNIVGRAIWHFVHHTPLHIWGKGPLFALG